MANDVIELVMAGTVQDQFFEIVQHFETGVASASDPVTLADGCISGFIATPQGSLVDCLSEDVAIRGYKAKRINNTGGPTVMRPITPVLGTITGEPINAASAYCAVSRYPHSGHWRTGRMFIPGIPESFETGNGYTGTAISNFGNFLADLSNFSSSGGTYKFGTWSRKFTLFFAPTYLALSPKIGIIRRRLTPVL